MANESLDQTTLHFPVVHLISILRHRFVRGNKLREIIDIRYLVIIEFEARDGTRFRRGPMERTVEQLDSMKVDNYRSMMDTYWSIRLLYPKYAREILSRRVDLTLHRSIWNKLPFEEAAALYQLEERNQLVYWRPYFTRIDITRIEDHLALRNLRLYLRNIEVDPTPLSRASPIRTRHDSTDTAVDTNSEIDHDGGDGDDEAEPSDDHMNEYYDQTDGNDH
jgi:hypothetical protein